MIGLDPDPYRLMGVYERTTNCSGGRAVWQKQPTPTVEGERAGEERCLFYVQFNLDSETEGSETGAWYIGAKQHVGTASGWAKAENVAQAPDQMPVGEWLHWSGANLQAVGTRQVSREVRICLYEGPPWLPARGMQVRPAYQWGAQPRRVKGQR